MKEKLQEIYDYYKNESTLGKSEIVIAMLTEMQETAGYLSEEAQKMAAEAAGVNQGYIAAVIKRIPHLHVRPYKHDIQICTSDRCKKQGGDQVLKMFQKLLKIKPGQVSKDGGFLLRTSYCMHNCAHGPNVSIDGELIPDIKPSDVPGLLRRYGAVDLQRKR